MADRLLLTGVCKRKQHVLFRVFATSDGMVIDAELYAAGRESETWTPRRRALTDGSASRYGCACRATALVFDDQMLDRIELARIQRGTRRWPIEATNISFR